MKNDKLINLINKLPFYIFVFLILPISFNFAFPQIIAINHNHYEMMQELGKVDMLNYLVEALELEDWDLEAYEVAEQLWQIQVIQIVLTVMQQLIMTVFILFALSMSIYYITRRRIKFGRLFRYTTMGLLVSCFLVLIIRNNSGFVFMGSLLLASMITGFLSYNELKMAVIKDYLGEENMNNGVY